MPLYTTSSGGGTPLARGAAILPGYYSPARLVQDGSFLNTTGVAIGGAVTIDCGITGGNQARLVSLPGTLPAGVEGCFQYMQEGGGLVMVGLAYLDASDTGVAAVFYKNTETVALTVRLATVVSGVYTGLVAGTVRTVFGSGSAMLVSPTWLCLEKSGTTYTVKWSTDGLGWTSGFTATVAGTPTEVAAGQVARLGGASDTTFSRLALHYLAVR